MKPIITDSEPLPQDVFRFIVDSIDTVPELEALLIFQDDAAREWSIGELVDRLYISSRAAAAVVAKLQRRALVIEGAQPARYRFNTDSPLAGLVDRLSRIYARHVALIARVIHEKPASALREFAKAFKVKPEE